MSSSPSQISTHDESTLSRLAHRFDAVDLEPTRPLPSPTNVSVNEPHAEDYSPQPELVPLPLREGPTDTLSPYDPTPPTTIPPPRFQEQPVYVDTPPVHNPSHVPSAAHDPNTSAAHMEQMQPTYRSEAEAQVAAVLRDRMLYVDSEVSIAMAAAVRQVVTQEPHVFKVALDASDVARRPDVHELTQRVQALDQELTTQQERNLQLTNRMDALELALSSKADAPTADNPPAVITDTLREDIDTRMHSYFSRAWSSGTLVAVARDALSTLLQEDEFVTQLGQLFIHNVGWNHAMEQLVHDAVQAHLPSPADTRNVTGRPKKSRNRRIKPHTKHHDSSSDTDESSSNHSTNSSHSVPRMNVLSNSENSDDSTKRHRSTPKTLTSRERRQRRVMVKHQAKMEYKIPVRSPLVHRFAKACDWRTYRLKNTDPFYSIEQSRKQRKQHKEIEKIMPRKFTGKDPVSILYFLERFVSTCNAFDVSEGNALWLLPSYMDKAAHSYITQTMGTINDIDHKQPRIVLWISVVQQLLDRYAGDQVLTVTNNEITSLAQRPGQTALEYHDHLMEKARRTGTAAYAIMDLMEIFTQNVLPSHQKAVSQRWIDETAKLRTRSRNNEYGHSVDYSHHSVLSLFDRLVSYADSLDADDSTSVETKIGSRHIRSNTRRQNVSSINTGLAPGDDSELPHTPTSALVPYPSTASPVTGYASTSTFSGSNSRRSPRSPENQDRRPLPKLPFQTLFKIPPGCQDITQAVMRFLNMTPFCGCCGLNRHTKSTDPSRQPHLTSECPIALPANVSERYCVLATKLVNHPGFQRATQDGTHTRIDLTRLPVVTNPHPTTSFTPPRNVSRNVSASPKNEKESL